MLTKFLLIGVGGSGGKTLRYTWRELERRLAHAGWTEGVPDAWQFIHIDIPEKPDVVEQDVPAEVGASLRYVGLATAPNLYPIYDDRVLGRGLEALAGWRVDPAEKLPPPYTGAGQRRVVGRIVTLAEITKVKDAIDEALTRLGRNEAQAELDALNVSLGYTEESNVEASAYVIASLAGGSGSGAVLDILELLRARATAGNEWLAEHLGSVLYTAETFKQLAPGERPGVEANSAAALAEFLAAVDHEGAVSAAEAALLAPGGALATGAGSRVGYPNFIVGLRNAELVFEQGNEVYEAVATAMAALMVNETVQKQFLTFTATNTDHPSPRPEFLMSRDARARFPCSGIGYSNVSLGRALFQRYAEERLARLTIDRLLRGHYQEVEDAAVRNEEDIVADVVKRWKDDFFKDTELWELGERDQVLEALCDSKLKIKRLAGFVKRSSDKLKAIASKKKGRDWLAIVNSQFDAEAETFRTTEREEREARARVWVPHIQQQLIETTERYAGRYGLWVTVELLRALSLQLEQAAIELDASDLDYQQQAGRFLNGIEAIFFKVKDAAIGTAHSSFNDATAARREALQRETEASLYKFTAALLREVKADLIPPLINALESARRELLSEETIKEVKDIAERWSIDAVPPHLTATKNQVLLEKQADYPRRFNEQMTGFGGAALTGEARALAQIIAGGWSSPTQATTPRLIVQDAYWMPAMDEARPTGQTASRAAFSVSLTHEQILAACRTWVRGQSPFAEHVSTTLNQWLYEKGTRTDRAKAFASALKRAIDASAPLIAINTKSHEALYTSPLAPPKTIISDIPIAPGEDDPAYTAARAVLEKARFTDADIRRAFQGSSHAQSIEISSFLSQTLDPVVIDSVTTPIHEDWYVRQTPAERQKFWKYRRARTLESFIPMGRARQLALVRGWYTARALGHLPELTRPWGQAPVRIWTRSGPLAFPPNLLGDEPYTDTMVLPALCESMILAYVSYSSGRHEELMAYMRLLELGSPPTGIDSEYVSLNSELASWIQTGQPTKAEPKAPAAPSPDPAIAGEASDEAEERRQAVHDWISERQNAHAEAAEAFELTAKTTLTARRGWEIRGLIAAGTADLLLGLEHADTRSLVAAGGELG